MGKKSAKDYSRLIAVMGGSFDPVHYGHLAAATAVFFELEAEKVFFVPVGKAPHKEDCEASAEDRLEMLRLAAEGYGNFEISDVEIKRPGNSFTADTVEELLNRESPGTRLVLILGADMLFTLEKWKNADKLFKLASFAAVTRPGYDDEKLIAEIDRLRRGFGAKVRVVRVPGVDISSTQIRERIKTGRPVSFLLPQAVENYIIERGLYSGLGEMEVYAAEKFPDMTGTLKKKLSAKRYNHTLGVCKTAVLLAKRYGCDGEKAFLAALLHDCAKDSDRALEHAAEGAEMASSLFGVSDREVLDAIRFHTTGRKDMTLLEKIIYVADCAEPGRGNMPKRELIESLGFSDIDKAFELCYEIKKEYTLSIGGKWMDIKN